MSRVLLTLAAIAGVSLAAPASAMSFQVDFPTLTYPTQPAPDAGKACTNLTTRTDDTCTAPAR